MKAITKVFFLNDREERFFGDGPYRLLKKVDETGSLRAASISMGLAYTKALRMIKNAEEGLGFALTSRSTGGKSGGGSKLTPQGREWLLKYETYKEACVKANEDIYRELFGEEIGCIIMASGQGKRFGGNKLMANLGGKPLIQWVLDATEGVFSKRLVVTVHSEIAELCKSLNIPVILHSYPDRNDMVRLGIDQMRGKVKACAFMPADQPLIGRGSLTALVQAVREDASDLIWRTGYQATVGSPVVFPSSYFDELMQLPKGKGGNAVLTRYQEKVKKIEVDDDIELKDIDTKEDLIYFEQHLSKLY